jgi:TonB family protein
MPEVKPPSFRWTEPPRWLPLAADGLGAAFGEFVQTNFFAGHPLDFKPAPELSAPALPAEPAPAQNSTLQVEGELAQRQLPSEISLTNWPYADVLAPCVVQAFVDTAGNVVSTVILSPSGYDAADERALEIARALRFAPASQPVIGKIIFNWHTVPVVPPTASS